MIRSTQRILVGGALAVSLAVGGATTAQARPSPPPPPRAPSPPDPPDPPHDLLFSAPPHLAHGPGSIEWHAWGPRLDLHHDPGVTERLADELALTTAQKETIRDLADGAAKEEARLRAEIAIATIDLRRALDEDAPDRAKVDGHVDRLAGLEGRLRKARLGAWVQMKRALTPAQRDKLRALRPPPTLRRLELRTMGPPGGWSPFEHRKLHRRRPPKVKSRRE